MASPLVRSRALQAPLAPQRGDRFEQLATAASEQHAKILEVLCRELRQRPPIDLVVAKRCSSRSRRAQAPGSAARPRFPSGAPEFDGRPKGTRTGGQLPPSAASPTTPKGQDDILPSAYTRHSLANLCGENFPRLRCAKRVPEKTAPRGERSTTNRARAASPRAGAMHPNT